MQHIHIRNTLLALIGLILLTLGLVLSYAPRTDAADFPKESQRPIAYASTTVYTLGANGVATRIVATSTRADATLTLPATSGRTALALQTLNCLPGATVWIQFNDVVATTSTGMYIQASSTLPLADSVPMVYGSIRASASAAGCSLLVTEFRSQP